MSNLQAPAISLFLISLLSIIFFTKEKVKNNETVLYGYLILDSFLIAFFEFYIILLNYTLPDSYLINLFNRFLMIGVLIWTANILMYLYNLSTPDEKKQLRLKRNIMTFDFIMITIMSFLPISLVNQNNVMTATGPAMTFIIIACMIHMFGIFFVILKNHGSNNREKHVPAYLLVFLILINVAMKVYVPEFIILSLTSTLTTLVMYFTIENPDAKLIAELNIAKEQAVKANKAKSDFLSSMSHEIRTPLNAIVGFSDCIKSADDLVEAKENADDIISSSNMLLEIVNGILDLSKIESGKLELVNVDYSPKIMFHEIEKLIIARIGSKNLKFEVDIAEDLPEVFYGDKLNLKKIIINLLTNAVKYTDSGYVYFKVMNISHKDDCRLIISVKDTGRGMKPEHLKKLFNKFQRVDEDKNTTIEGTGLGLAITKQLIEMMNGKISVQSTYGEGSEFLVSLPQKISENKLEENNIIINEVVNLDGMKILAVDDNKMNLKVLTKLLSNHKIDLKLVSSGFECIDLIKKGNKYDVILLDDMMPKMRGTEVIKYLFDIDSFNIPLIALTANAISGVKESYLELGFSAYLSKPIIKADLESELYKIYKKIEKKQPLNSIITKEIEVLDLSPNYKKIMVVDDNKMNLKIISKLLQNDPYDISIIENGEDSINKLKTEKFDLVYMDIMMPDMNGIETLKQIRLNNINVKVVALTADAVEGAREMYLKEGFNDYMSKPINRQLLIDNIEKHTI